MISKQTVGQLIALVVLAVVGYGVFAWVQTLPEREIEVKEEPVDFSDQTGLEMLVPPTAAGALRAEYFEDGSPSVAEMDEEFKERLIDTYELGLLTEIGRQSDGYAVTVILVVVADPSENGAQSCAGFYSVCVVLRQSGDTYQLLQVISDGISQPEFDSLVLDKNLVIIKTLYRRPYEAYWNYYSVDLSTGQKIHLGEYETGMDVKGQYDYSGIVRGDHNVFFRAYFTTEEEGKPSIYTYHSAELRDNDGVLKEFTDPSGGLLSFSPLDNLDNPNTIIFTLQLEGATTAQVYEYDPTKEPRLTLIREIP